MKIRSFSEFKDEVAKVREMIPPPRYAIQLLFRGHSKDHYNLQPTISRYNLSQQELLSFERFLHEEFKSRLTGNKIGSITLNIPQNQNTYYFDWCLLFQQRHLEIPTRLLDWSMKEEVALYFALNNKFDHGQDGHVWILCSIKDFSIFPNKNTEIDRIEQDYKHLDAGEEDREFLTTLNPFDLDMIYLLHNSYNHEEWIFQVGEQRRFRQNGKFTACPNSRIQTSLDNNIIGKSFMKKIKIAGEHKTQILEELTSQYDFSEEKTIPIIPEDTQLIITDIIKKAQEKVIMQYPDTNCSFKLRTIANMLMNCSTSDLNKLLYHLNSKK